MIPSFLRPLLRIPPWLVAATVGAACQLAALPAAAQEAGAPATWRVGVAGSVIKRAYKGADDRTVGLPLISYENWLVAVGVPTLDLKAYSSETLSVRFRLRYAFDGYKGSDSSYLQGMDTRKDSLWAGVAAVWRTDYANVNAELLGDTLGNSKGARAALVVDHRYPVGMFGITPRIGGEWVDSKFVQYYYGVKASEAREGRPGYGGDDAVNAIVGIRLDYSPAAQHTLFLDAGHTHFGSGIKDSPLVDKSGQTSLSLGYLYRF